MECRDVPGFPDYQMCTDGTITNRKTKREVTINKNLVKGQYYESVHLRDEDGVRRHRNVRAVRRRVFPEEGLVDG